ncbi:MAG: 2-oxo acid dehydrogenase subunit E2 [bacterium]|nr:2-oxo acid dehydrogenase subunit E2 [bacterium]
MTVGVESRRRLSAVRRRIGDNLLKSLATSPHASISVNVDYSAVEHAREELGAEWRRQHGYSLTYLPFVASAVCRAMREFPIVNSTLEGEELVTYEAVHLGIAVDVAFAGLFVPVLRNAEQLSVEELAVAIAGLASRTRAKELTTADLTGGTYTVTNPGPYGTHASSPIINQPQVAILALDGISLRPGVVRSQSGTDEIVPLSQGLITQAFDHRVFDGAYCAAFLRHLADTVTGTDWVGSFSAEHR